MDVNLFDFNLPDDLIAQSPLKKRTDSRLLLLNKLTGEVTHRRFMDILHCFQEGDTLVLNDTKVIPARLLGTKKGTGARIELLLLKQLDAHRWEALVKPGKKVRMGTALDFGDGKLTALCEDETNFGGRIVRFEYSGVFHELLDELGQMPLPPYIKEQLEKPERYQTVYARQAGSAAAPTAGLHFTRDLLHSIENKGVQIAYITLHVGLGTFRPVKVENVTDHTMHAEFYQMNSENARKIREAKRGKRRIIAVGTTSARTLETLGRKWGAEVQQDQGWTNIFIYPGYSFRLVDALVTNFHLPKSSLVMMVSALAGREKVLMAYQEAIAQRYRFFSFGDAMFIY